MLRRPPRSTRTDTLFPYTTLFRSFAFQIILEQFSGGIEHGHMHIHDPTPAFPYAIMVSLCVHAFLEAMPLQGHHHEELLWGIALHHIPAAFVLGSILLQHRVKKWGVVFLLILFAVISDWKDVGKGKWG